MDCGVPSIVEIGSSTSLTEMGTAADHPAPYATLICHRVLESLRPEIARHMFQMQEAGAKRPKDPSRIHR